MADEGTTTTATTAEPPTTTSNEINIFTDTGSQTASVPEALKAFSEFVPQEHQDKQWFKNVTKAEDPKQEFFKQFENLQTLIGQKQGLQPPNENSTPEQIKEFYKAIGVPEDVAAYKIEPTKLDEADKELGDFLNSIRGQEDTLIEVKKAALALGVTPKQLQGLAEAYDKTFVANHKESLVSIAQQKKQLDEDFTVTADRYFGNAKSQALELGNKYIWELLTVDERADLDAQNNKTLVVAALLANRMHNKYVKEDGGVTTGGTSNDTGAWTPERIKAEGMRLMSTPEYKDTMHPGHSEAVKKADSFYALHYSNKK